MSLPEFYLHPRATDNCIQCSTPPPCACAADQDCIFIGRTCSSCTQNVCQAKVVGSKTSKGVGKGAVAGAVIGVLLFLALAIGLFLWYRKNQRRNRMAEGQKPKPDVPASAQDVLSRPDPIEKPPSQIYATASTPQNPYYSPASSAQRPLSTQSTQSNPFTDTHSIQTTRTEGTNAIPIALDQSSHRSDQPDQPARPPRSPELNLDHVNMSNDSLRNPTGDNGTSMRSGLSANSRHSYMTNASYSSDFLEAPVIVTGHKGTVRQMLGVTKAEVVAAPASQHSSLKSNGSKNLAVPAINRSTLGSPLAMSSFGPADALTEADESELAYAHDPFGDEHSPLPSSRFAPPSPGSTATFGDERPSHSAANSTEWKPGVPRLPFAKSNADSRPSSVSTQAGSVIDIGSATRVNVGLHSPDGTGVPRSPYRTTMAKLVSPSTAGFGSMEVQQRNGGNAQALTPMIDNRTSISSAISTSTRADSILESFPFVPPSPISNRPIRSPPVSPLPTQSFSNGVTPPSPRPVSNRFERDDTRNSGLSELMPPNRHKLGMSSASHSSTASTGLGSFPFQISEGNSAPPSAFNSTFNNEGRQRASLDTLALTSDLSSYPLGIDVNDDTHTK